MKTKRRILDLFAGIGGFRLAFESVGFETVFTCEWDKFAQKTYLANFGETTQIWGDVRSLNTDMIPDFDVLCAGFPCQPFSIAGVSKKQSLGRAHGFHDPIQGTLFFEIVRILKATKPRAFMLENVKNLISHDKGRTFSMILRQLTDAGYLVQWRIINSFPYVPQNRNRIYIVGFSSEKDALGFKWPWLRPLLGQGHGASLESILEKQVPEKYHLTNKLWNYLQSYKEKHREAGNGFGYSMADLKGATRTLSARYHKDGSEILIPVRGKNPRRLTPRECARLMGFPDDFKIVVSDTQAYRQFGNSVVVPMVQLIAHEMAKTLSTIHFGETA